MKEEVPIPNEPLTAEEQAVADALTDVELAKIDGEILANSNYRWRKVAMVVGKTMAMCDKQHPRLSDGFYARRVTRLVEEGRLESQGNLLYMRFSEVRLPTQSISPSET